MPTNPNMVAIQTVTVGAGGAASISFTSIPQTYTDLKLVLSVRDGFAGVADDMLLTLNGSTSGFSNRYIYGNGSSVFSGTAYGNLVGNPVGSTATANTFSNIEIYFPNYTSANQKSYSVDSVSENNATEAYAFMIAGRNTTTSAITSLSVAGGSNFAQYSTATLYGVTSAGYGAKATGGIITQDANYYYHTFLASGTFTPTQSLSCDLLVVAGGGAGGRNASGGGQGGMGGGGAGGLLGFTSQSLTAQNYTVTIGGGAATNSSSTVGTSGSNSQFGSLTAAVGGGGGGRDDIGNPPANGTSGGSGGGGSYESSAGAGTSGQGNAGSTGGFPGPYGGGGGGAGEAGGTDAAGEGGDGSSAYSSWGLATSTGENSGGTYYYAGGGGGGAPTGKAGGLGGGGTGSSGATGNAVAGTINTGGGGGGSGGNANAGTGGAGGSGIVIVRYAK